MPTASIAGSAATAGRAGAGGTAVGTGINAHPTSPHDRRRAFQHDRQPFVTSPNYFESLSTQDAAVELSGQLAVARRAT
ncbi:MAG: hypothetical protein R2856_32005 [Caldilineaceae bacterium]